MGLGLQGRESWEASMSGILGRDWIRCLEGRGGQLAVIVQRSDS